MKTRVPSPFSGSLASSRVSRRSPKLIIHKNIVNKHTSYFHIIGVAPFKVICDRLIENVFIRVPVSGVTACENDFFSLSKGRTLNNAADLFDKNFHLEI